MILETKTNASYNKLEYKHICKVDSHDTARDFYMNWL